MKIAVLMGGTSAERDVSLRSGSAVAGALRSLGHTVCEVDARKGYWSLPEGAGAVFLALHGAYGEDGQIQAELERLGVPYTGCGVEASRIAFDKLATKQRCEAAGVRTAPHVLVRSLEGAWPAGWHTPVVVKPVHQGSSVGLSFVEDQAQWRKALAEGFRHDKVLLVEEKIAGREVTVAILEEQALPVVEVRPKLGRYDYASKYTAGATEYLCPAPFPEDVTRDIQSAALGAFHAIGGRDYARVDLIVTPAGQPVVLEVNTLPGMTETSLFPKAAAAAGLEYAALCQRMVDLALRRAESVCC